MVKVTAQDL